MRERVIHFSCCCGRRLTAMIYTKPARLEFMDHGRPLKSKICPTPGCRRDYSRITVEEFKENVFSGY